MSEKDIQTSFFVNKIFVKYIFLYIYINNENCSI